MCKIFGKNEAQKAEAERELLEKYGLENLGDEKDVKSVKKIINEMMGTGLMDASIRLNFKSPPEQKLQVLYQRSILEQNFIIIRQLDKIAKLLEEK